MSLALPLLDIWLVCSLPGGSMSEGPTRTSYGLAFPRLCLVWLAFITAALAGVLACSAGFPGRIRGPRGWNTKNMAVS